MRRAILLAVFVLLVSPATGQWVEVSKTSQ